MLPSLTEETKARRSFLSTYLWGASKEGGGGLDCLFRFNRVFVFIRVRAYSFIHKWRVCRSKNELRETDQNYLISFLMCQNSNCVNIHGLEISITYKKDLQ